MDSGTIMHVKAGKLPPTALLEKCFAANQTLFGFAAQDKGIVEVTSFGLKDPANAKINFVESALELVKTFNKGPCILFFNENDNLLEDDKQPFPLVVEGKDTLLAAIAQGSFPTTWQKDSAHTPAYHFMAEYLAPEIEALYKEFKTIDKLMAELDAPRFRRSLKAYLVPQGSLCLIPNKGSPMLFSENTFNSAESPGLEADWGIITNAHGYATTVTKAAVPAVSGSFLARLRAKDAAEPAGDTPMTGSPASEPATVDPLKEDTVQCPEAAEVHRKKWLWDHFGKEYRFPSGWKDRHCKFPAAVLLPASPIRRQMEFEKAQKQASGQPKPPVVKPEQPETVPAELQPIMGAKSKEHVMNLIKDGVLTADPKQIQALEKPYDKFTDQIAINEDIPLMWTYEGYVTLAQNNVYAIAQVCEQFRRRLLAIDPTIVSKMLAKITKTEEKVAVEAPAAGSFLAKLRGAA